MHRMLNPMLEKLYTINIFIVLEYGLHGGYVEGLLWCRVVVNFGIVIVVFNYLLAFRAAIEYEKKGFAENYEHGQVMEKKLVAMAREMEKLRAEIANAEKRARAAVAAGNPGMHFYAWYGLDELANCNLWHIVVFFHGI